MSIKYGRKVLTLVVVLVILWIALPTVAQEKPNSKDKVAVVNGTVITQEQFERKVEGAQQQIASRGKRLNDLELQAMKKDILENMINTELLFQESKRLGVTVEEVAINEQLKKLKGRFHNEEEFKRALTLLNLSEGDLKTEIERGLAIQQLVETQVGGKIAVSDKEVKTYYDSHPEAFRRPEEVRASHILILVESGADEPKKALARQKLEQVQEKLKKGEDFTTLAKEYSEGPSRAKGGDLGYFRRGQMVKSFEDVAFALKPGEVSGLVETKFGYHLIKVIDKKPETVIAFVDVKDRLQQFLKQKKVEGQVGQYVEGLKEKATIGRFLTEAN